MLYQYSVRGFHHPHHSALGTKIVPVQCQQEEECLGLSVWLRLAGAGASQQGLTCVTRILFLCHQTSGLRISYPSSTESHLAPSLDYIFLFVPKWTLFFRPPGYKSEVPLFPVMQFGLAAENDGGQQVHVHDMRKLWCPYCKSCILGGRANKKVGPWDHIHLA